MIAVSNVLPHPNPPLHKGRELDFLVSPLYKGYRVHISLPKASSPPRLRGGARGGVLW